MLIQRSRRDSILPPLVNHDKDTPGLGDVPRRTEENDILSSVYIPFSLTDFHP